MKRINRWVVETAVVFALACAARADVSASWNQDADGNWSAGGNWAGGSAAAGATGVATFSNAISAGRTVTVDSSPWTINSLLFSNTGAFGWNIAGGTLDLAGTTPTITVNSGSNAKVASVFSGSAGLIKAGDGTLTLSGENIYSGATTLSAGTLQVGDGTSATANAGNGALEVGGNTLNLNLRYPSRVHRSRPWPRFAADDNPVYSRQW
jgi:autotransporter-associated beta strand protein